MMMRSRGRSVRPFVWGAVLLSGVGMALGDVWDPGDQALLSTNELIHGSEQLHELGPGGVNDPGGRDFDFFRIGERPLASYEVVVDGVTSDIAYDLELQRWTLNGPVQDAVPTMGNGGTTRSLRWQNTANQAQATALVRVGSTRPCFPFDCTSAKSAYHIRSYETTYSVPRFNNNASQVTLLMVQNTSDAAVTGAAHFWSTSGALLGSSPFNLAAKQVLVQNTATLAFAAGASGSITVSHDGRYGDLAGKVVALEPATGFTFDTAMVPRPR